MIQQFPIYSVYDTGLPFPTETIEDFLITFKSVNGMAPFYPSQNV